MNQLLPIIRRKRRSLIVEAEVTASASSAPAPFKTEPTSEPLKAILNEPIEPQPIKPSEDTPEN